MKFISVRALSFICLLMLTWANSGVSAESNKNSNCEFNNYDGDLGSQKIENLISTIFVEEAFKDKNPKFERLDSIINELSNPDCKLQDGRLALNFILNGFTNAFKRINWKLLLPKIQSLRRAHPNAAYPILVEAKYWTVYAWQARGTGFASTVTPEGWELFYERIHNAESVLIKNKKLGSTMPAWYELMIQIQQSLGSSQDEQDKYFFEGVERYKTYLPLYISKRNSLEPKWGGSWKSVDQFINWSADNTKNTSGLSMYSLLYFGVHDNMLSDSNFWKDTLVSWPKFKQGLEDLIRLNPKSQFDLNIYASMACEANDKKTYLKIRSKIPQPIEWSWQYYNSVDGCDLKYGYKKKV